MMLGLLELFVFFFLVLMMFSHQPLGMGVFLLFYCFISSVLVYTFFSSWYSLSLFLIYIGGMLVLFGYVLVLIPNFVFSHSGSFFYFSFFILFFFFPCGDGGGAGVDFSFSFFSYSNSIVYLSLAVILFVGLVSVAKICFFQVGALRPFFLFYV